MSRIGKKPVAMPKGVSVALDGSQIKVTGPKGTLVREIHSSVKVTMEDGQLMIERAGEDRIARGQHGLARTLVANMVQGVVEPFKKSLEIHGVGYRAELKGNLLNLQVGLSHDVNHPIPAEVQCQVEKMTVVHLSSANKELLGRVAAEIRAYRPCEPYKGKGIKYMGERIRRKEGKTGT